jgi:hypothetical protein
MKFEFPLLAALLLMGTHLLARIAVQGIEQALLATAVEYGADGIRAVNRLFPITVRLGR